MRKLASVALAVLAACFHADGQIENGVSVNISPDIIYPGDIFRMQVIRMEKDFARFKLEVPQIEHLHLLGIEESPVRLESGQYLQQETWIFQSDASGEIVLDGIIAEVTSRNTTRQLKLPSVTVNIKPYPEVDKDTSPIALEDVPAGQTSPGYGIYLFITLVIILPLYIYFRKRRISVISAKQSTSISPLQALLTDLEKGNISPASLVSFYEDKENRETMSEDLRKKIETAIYAQRGNPDELAAAIRKEVPQ